MKSKEIIFNNFNIKTIYYTKLVYNNFKKEYFIKIKTKDTKENIYYNKT